MVVGVVVVVVLPMASACQLESLAIILVSIAIHTALPLVCAGKKPSRCVIVGLSSSIVVVVVVGWAPQAVMVRHAVEVVVVVDTAPPALIVDSLSYSMHRRAVSSTAEGHPSSPPPGVHPLPVHMPYRQFVPVQVTMRQSGPVQTWSDPHSGPIHPKDKQSSPKQKPIPLHPEPVHPAVMQSGPKQRPSVPQSDPLQPTGWQLDPVQMPSSQSGPSQPAYMHRSPTHSLPSQSGPRQPGFPGGSGSCGSKKSAPPSSQSRRQGSLQKRKHGWPHPLVQRGPGGPVVKETVGKLFLSSMSVLQEYGGAVIDRVTGVGVPPEVVNSGLMSFVIGNGGAKMLLVK